MQTQTRACVHTDTHTHTHTHYTHAHTHTHTSHPIPYIPTHPGDYPPFAPNAFSLAAIRREGSASAAWRDAVKRGYKHGSGDVLMTVDWDMLPRNNVSESEMKQVCAEAFVLYVCMYKNVCVLVGIDSTI